MRLVIIFTLIPLALNGQVVHQNQLESLFPLSTQERPQLDSSINIKKLSLESCNKLIEKMFRVDQQYRDSLYHTSDKKKQQQFTHLMTINDPVHQIILLKILERYGWPCKDQGRDLAFKTWIIAWHARSEYNILNRFYPYLIIANQKKCINSKLFFEFKNQIARMKRIYSEH